MKLLHVQMITENQSNNAKEVTKQGKSSTNLKKATPRTNVHQYMQLKILVQSPKEQKIRVVSLIDEMITKNSHFPND